MLEFASLFLLLFAVIEAPGYLLLRSLKFNYTWALCCAPLLGFSFLVIVGQALALAHISVSALFLLGITLGLALVVFLFSKLDKRTEISLPVIDLRFVAFSALMGAFLGYQLFISRMGSLDALFQSYDVTQHLNLIRSMADSGNYTSLGVNPYMSAADAAIAPVDYSGFYPSAWHVLCAVVVSITGATTTLVINASMLLLACVVFPVAMDVFIAVIFPGNSKVQFAATVCNLAFLSFPWFILVFGPVYANIAGFSFMPIVMAFFVLLFGQTNDSRGVLFLIGALAISLVSVVLCHPNVVFTCIVLLAPFCVHLVYCAMQDKGCSELSKLLCCAGFILFCTAFWYVCYKLPVFQDIVTHEWYTYTTPIQGVINLITLAYNFGFSDFEFSAQLLLAFIVAIGAIRLLRTSGKRWLVVSYCITCFIELESATRSGSIRQFLAGFWYTDPTRLAAICAIAAIPLAAVGFSLLVDFVTSQWKKLDALDGCNTKPIYIAFAVACCFLVINFFPDFDLAGIHKPVLDEEEEISAEEIGLPEWLSSKSVHTTFGDYRSYVAFNYERESPFSKAEQDFIDRVKEEIGDDTLVINNPTDGSFLAYGMEGLRVYYRNFVGAGAESETEASEIIRTRLSSYTTDSKVKEALKSLGAKYVIILEGGPSRAGFMLLREGEFDEAQYAGISSITEETPGFTCLLKSRYMRLYSIDEL